MATINLTSALLDDNIGYTRLSLLIYTKNISIQFAISRVKNICITFEILRSKAEIMFIVAIFVKKEAL